MRAHTLLLFVFLMFGFEPKINESATLPLLVPKGTFNPNILDCVFDDFPDSTSVIMLRIQINYQKDTSPKHIPRYDVRITKLRPKNFAFFNLVSDKYFGYLYYKKHTVLVFGDENIGYFFKKTKVKKYFDFLSTKHYDDINKPPIAIEPEVFVYDFTNGKFTPTITGRLYFFQ